jgi:uncharacterized metal-binding protein YceD (DUF177 family)
MKIEFRKIPLNDTEFEIYENSVKFSGIFSKISQKLAKLESNITGDCEIDCCKCGKTFSMDIDEKIDMLLSDGIYLSSEDEEDDNIVIEIEDHIVDFNEILNSEIESLKSEYFTCEECSNKQFEDIEY